MKKKKKNKERERDMGKSKKYKKKEINGITCSGNWIKDISIDYSYYPSESFPFPSNDSCREFKLALRHVKL